MPALAPARSAAPPRAVPWRGAVTVALGVAVAVALPVGVHLLALPRAQEWQTVVATALQDNAGGVWRWMRGGTRLLVAPALVVVVATSVVATVRRGRGGPAVVAAVVALTAFALVEGMKHGVVPLPGWPGAEPPPLSGHVAATGAALVPCVVAARRRRGAAAWLGALVLAGVGAAVVLARWHLVREAVLAALAVAAWTVVAAAVVRATRRARPGDPTTATTTAATTTTAGLASALGGLALLAASAAWVGSGTVAGATAALVAAAVALAGAALVTASAAVGLARALDPVDVVHRREELPHGEDRRVR